MQATDMWFIPHILHFLVAMLKKVKNLVKLILTAYLFNCLIAAYDWKLIYLSNIVLNILSQRFYKLKNNITFPSFLPPFSSPIPLLFKFNSLAGRQLVISEGRSATVLRRKAIRKKINIAIIVFYFS